MRKVLFIIGALSIVAGCSLVLPTLSQAVKVGSPFFALGAPISMNGITLMLTGLLLLGMGEILGYFKRTLSLLLMIRDNTEIKAVQEPILTELRKIASSLQKSREDCVDRAILEELNKITEIGTRVSEIALNTVAIGSEKALPVNASAGERTYPTPVKGRPDSTGKLSPHTDTYWSTNAWSVSYEPRYLSKPGAYDVERKKA